MKAGWNFFAALLAGFLLALGITAGAFYLNLGVHSNYSQWAAEINQKKRLLARQTPPPRLLLVGGSGTLFGLSARELEAQTGWRTLNLGTHAALGTTYILREAQQLAKPGDTILLVLEYELYTYGKVDQGWADALLVDYLVARDPAFFHSLSLPEKWSVFMLTSNRRLIQGLKNRRRTERPLNDLGVYTAGCINQWGDQTGHTQAARPSKPGPALQGKSTLAVGMPEHPNGFPVIAAFCAWARTHHIRVLATYPNLIDQPEYHGPVAQRTAEQIKSFFTRLGVPVVGEYTESTLPADQFFDTVYHLTEEAAQARTRRLAAELKPLLGPAPDR